MQNQSTAKTTKATLSIALCAALVGLGGCASMNDAGWTTLVDASTQPQSFNAVGTANWAQKDGALQASQGSKDPAYLVTKNSYRDFMIRAEFWASDDANSGIFIRCANPAKIDAVDCYEVNIFDQRPDPTYGTAAIVGVAKVVPMPKAGGHWNTFEITAQGSHLTVVFNGQKTVDAQDSKLSQGPVALQWGSGVIKFRNVQIKPL